MNSRSSSAAAKSPVKTTAITPPSVSASYWLIGLSILLIIIFGAETLRGLIERHKTQTVAQLQAIATLRTSDIETWLQQRRREAELVRSDSLLMALIDLWQRNGDVKTQIRLLERFETLRSIFEYQAVTLVDHRRTVVISTADQSHIAPEVKQAIDRAMTTGKAQFSDFYRDHTGKKKHLFLDLVVTLGDRQQFALVFRLQQQKFFHFALQRWLLSSANTEILLFKRNGDAVLFLNETHDLADNSLPLMLALKRADALSAQLASGRVLPENSMSGVDYRGVRVLASATAVAGTSWYLMVKKDWNAIFTELRWDLIWIGSALVLALMTVVTGGILLHQWRALQRAAERERMLTEASLDTVFQVLPDAYFRIADDGTVLDYRAQQQSQCYKSSLSLLNNRLQHELPARVAKQLTFNIAKATSVGTVTTFEYEMSTDGDQRFFEARLAKLSDDNQLIMVVRDITERKLAQDSLIESQFLLQEAQAQAHIGNWELDPVTMKAFWSDELFRILGIDVNGDAGTERLATVLHPDDREAVLGSLQCAVRDGTKHHMEYRIIRPDGEIRWIECEAKQLYDERGKLLKLRGIAQDITRRKLDELKLQQSEARFRALFERMPSGVAVFEAVADGTDFIFKELNNAAEKIEQVKRNKLIGKAVTDAFPGVKEFGLFDVFQRVWTTGRAEFFPATIYKDENNPGSWRENWVYKLPSGDIVAVYDDISERKQAEGALNEQLDELRRWHHITLDREGRILQLKQEVNTLLAELERPARYASAEKVESDAKQG